MNEVARHYDLLVDEGNDPVLDTPELAAYMNGWDGDTFITAMKLDGTQDVLEIGVGTGRLAVRTAPLCRTFTGIDLSGGSIQRAEVHLADCPHARLICADFMTWQTENRFDVIYSSLTFMHLADKEHAVRKIAALLKPGGRTVISLSRDSSDRIDYGTRQLNVYPDNPMVFAAHMREAGLWLQSIQEKERAIILTAERGGGEAWASSSAG